MDYKKLIKKTPPKKRFALPTLASLIPQPPRTVATLNAEVERDGMGHEHLHARLRDHTGVVLPAVANGAYDLEVEPVVVRKKKREPLYKRLGDTAAPPRSEREYPICIQPLLDYKGMGAEIGQQAMRTRKLRRRSRQVRGRGWKSVMGRCRGWVRLAV